MGTFQAVATYADDNTLYTPVTPIIGKLKNTNLLEGSEDKADILPTGYKRNFSVLIPKHAVAPPLKKIEGTFRLLQMWEGRVLFIDNDRQEFTAIIIDKTNLDLADEKVYLSIEEIPRNDLSLLKEGAVFYWSIGYADYPGRPRTRESRIRFRRLPKWSSQELNKARETGASLAKLFSSD